MAYNALKLRQFFHVRKVKLVTTYYFAFLRVCVCVYTYSGRRAEKFSRKNIFLTVTVVYSLLVRKLVEPGGTKLKFPGPGISFEFYFVSKDKTSGVAEGGIGVCIGSSRRERNTIIPRNCTLEEKIYRRWKVVSRIFSSRFFHLFSYDWKAYFMHARGFASF